MVTDKVQLPSSGVELRALYTSVHIRSMECKASEFPTVKHFANSRITAKRPLDSRSSRIGSTASWYWIRCLQRAADITSSFLVSWALDRARANMDRQLVSLPLHDGMSV